MKVIQVNNKDLQTTAAEIEQHVLGGGLVILSEVTNRKLLSLLPRVSGIYLLDPQHVGVGTMDQELSSFSPVAGESAVLHAMTSASLEAWLKQQVDRHGPTIQLMGVIEKPDMDSIAALVVAREIAFGYSFTPDFFRRVMDIHRVDSHSMGEWDPSYNQIREVRWSNILGAYCSDRSVDLEHKIDVGMKSFLERGKLPEGYREKVEAEWEVLNQSQITMIKGIGRDFPLVVSLAQASAAGLIYSIAPFGVAYSPNFMGQGPKFTVMEFQGGRYLDLAGFFSYMNSNYPQPEGTWGGNIASGAGGSPVPCGLDPQLVAEELAKFIK